MTFSYLHALPKEWGRLDNVWEILIIRQCSSLRYRRCSPLNEGHQLHQALKKIKIKRHFLIRTRTRSRSFKSNYDSLFLTNI